MSLSGLLVIEKGFLQSFAERTAELLCRSGCQSDGQWAPRLVGRTNVRQAFMSTMCNFIHARSKPSCCPDRFNKQVYACPQRLMLVKCLSMEGLPTGQGCMRELSCHGLSQFMTGYDNFLFFGPIFAFL
ncbi:hypothetical protein T11_23 [Trichinella zimbabwensis]|uniref:Uncharacterized protein n=1 Tax=Trichinella zimbabwensis TaxID=268475 RepID=A0A0V1HEN0_9BILA|nr:hypothetical protein T11_23 [Trichinella zimbabwensis]